MLASLMEGLGPDHMRELLKGFTDKVHEIIEALQDKEAVEDPAYLKSKAHELKGMAANFGFTELNETAKALEDGAGTLDPAERDKLLNALPEAARRAENAIDQWLYKS